MSKLDLNNYLKLRAVSYYDANNELKFDPPVYEQRYTATIKVLEHEYWRGKLKKVIDFGCAEMKLLTLLKRVDGIEHILEVDIDEELLKPNIQRAKPLVSDYLCRRTYPLRIDIYKGSVDSPVSCIKNADAVIAVELIEHLHPDVFDGVPFNIFGFINPKIVIITTPNAEFNVLFNITQTNGFRHPDHKFEWTRTQFKSWCFNICERFPNYQVSIIGIGKGPPETRRYGCVSQMAVFVRKDIFNIPIALESPDDNLLQLKKNYKLLHSTEFPYAEDNRDNNQKILDEAKYHIARYVGMKDRFWNLERNIYEIPIPMVFEFVFPLAFKQEELETLLRENGYEIENHFLLMKEQEDDTSSDEDFFENYSDKVENLDIMDDDEKWE